MTQMTSTEQANICQGEFTTFKHVKTRKVFTIEIEFPEEQGRMVLETLGMPIGGESKPVAIALLHKNIASSSNGRTAPFEGVNCGSNPREATTEGDKLRIRAIMLCKDRHFQDFICTFIPNPPGKPSEHECSWWIKVQCNIESRSELATNIGAQEKFKELLNQYKNWQYENQYKNWQYENQYKDNLERM